MAISSKATSTIARNRRNIPGKIHSPEQEAWKRNLIAEVDRLIAQGPDRKFQVGPTEYPQELIDVIKNNAENFLFKDGNAHKVWNVQDAAKSLLGNAPNLQSVLRQNEQQGNRVKGFQSFVDDIAIGGASALDSQKTNPSFDLTGAVLKTGAALAFGAAGAGAFGVGPLAGTTGTAGATAGATAGTTAAGTTGLGFSGALPATAGAGLGSGLTGVGSAGAGIGTGAGLGTAGGFAALPAGLVESTATTGFGGAGFGGGGTGGGFSSLFSGTSGLSTLIGQGLNLAGGLVQADALKTAQGQQAALQSQLLEETRPARQQALRQAQFLEEQQRRLLPELVTSQLSALPLLREDISREAGTGLPFERRQEQGTRNIFSSLAPFGLTDSSTSGRAVGELQTGLLSHDIENLQNQRFRLAGLGGVPTPPVFNPESGLGLASQAGTQSNIFGAQRGQALGGGLSNIGQDIASLPLLQAFTNQINNRGGR